MLGWLLCKLGVHDNVITGGNVGQYGQQQSVWGGCIRCNKPWQWDN
jgi:hypothetical protein